MALSVGASTVTAHVPDHCVSLFHAAGEATNGVVRNGNEASETAFDGLDAMAARAFNEDHYGLLADKLAQLLGSQTDMFIKLERAVICAAGE